MHGQEGQWEPPAVGVWKLNTDATFIPSTGEAAAGQKLAGTSGAVRWAATNDMQEPGGS